MSNRHVFLVFIFALTSAAAKTEINTVLNSTKEGLGELKQLNLNANQIRSSKIEGSALRDARTLKKLEARGNKLSRVPSLSNTTESVDLSGNAIRKLELKRISRLTNLKELILDKNKIKEVPYETFIQLQELKLLSLSSNLIEKFPRMLPCSLEVINLENNQIIKIQSNTFVQCQQLREINLKGNPMAPEVSAPEYVFRPLRFLRSVSIDWDEDGYERERTKRRTKGDEITIDLDSHLAPPFS